jgi:glucose/arabinose dehydrogenase/peroxiredoxin
VSAFRTSALGLLVAGVCACAPPPERIQPITAAELEAELAARQGKIVLVNFWATWCEPCLEEIPDLMALEAELGDQGFEVVFVSVDDPASLDTVIQPFIDQWSPEFESFLSMEPEMTAIVDVVDLYWNEVLPTSFVLDRNGAVTMRIQGGSTREEFDAAVRPLLFKETAFESEGMALVLEELTEIDDVVWAIDFIDADTMIFTIRGGDLALMDLATRETRLLDGVPEVLRIVFDALVDGGGRFGPIASAGLFDVLVDPDFATNRMIYLAYVKPIGDGHALAVAKAKLEDDRLVGTEDIFIASNPSDAPGRWGARLAMDQDRYLYVAVGDRLSSDGAQDLSNHLGKILRLNDEGSAAAGNPFAGQANAAAEVWTYGHRNPQGLTLHPETGRLYESEHGPDGGDEINLIEQGKNYGWPVITRGVSREGESFGSGTEQPGMEQPLKYYVPGIAPSGLTFYTGDRYPAWRGNLFSGSLNRMHLNRLVLDGNSVTTEERLLTGWGERIREVTQGPDGLLYLATDSGKIVRIVPQAAPTN